MKINLCRTANIDDKISIFRDILQGLLDASLIQKRDFLSQGDTNDIAMRIGHPLIIKKNPHILTKHKQNTHHHTDRQTFE